MEKVKKYRFLIPVIHCILALVYMPLIFVLKPDSALFIQIPRNEVISFGFERAMTFAISYILGCIAIFLIWNLLFKIFDGKISKLTIIVFGCIFAVCFFCLFTIWPDSFINSIDNFTTYSYAVRFFPEYWHSMYSACIYAAALFVFPNIMSISVLQLLALVCAVGFVFERITVSPVLKGKGRWLALLLFLIPDTFSIATDAYRTEQYTILCMFFVTLIIMDCIDKKVRSTKELIALMILGGFIGVWRTEGFVLGLLGFLTLLIFAYNFKFKKILLFTAGLIASFIIITVPQKLGDIKYYGKDYSFINSFPALQNILNAGDYAHLKYTGVEEDIASLDRVTPIEALKVWGMEGYRSVNVYNGQLDINQSLASDEVGKAYMKGYLSLLLHNPYIYARTQLGMVLQAFTFSAYPYTVEYTGPGIDIPQWEYTGWDLGKKDILEGKFTPLRYRSGFLGSIGDGILHYANVYKNIATSAYVRGAVFALSCVLLLVICVAEFVRAIKKKSNAYFFIALPVVIFGQFVLIALVMPAGATAYFHACFYSTFITDIVYIVYKMAGKANEKKEVLK